ncbi:hypothetical protein TNCV_903981 [Trichonephila clavipes]|nr:hypothetical protein TNCV_903981 [Trichonephila clavipes]
MFSLVLKVTGETSFFIDANGLKKTKEISELSPFAPPSMSISPKPIFSGSLLSKRSMLAEVQACRSYIVRNANSFHSNTMKVLKRTIFHFLAPLRPGQHVVEGQVEGGPLESLPSHQKYFVAAL